MTDSEKTTSRFRTVDLAYIALFAVLILFLFLRDLKPTFTTLLSIPISIVFALVMMYFS